MTLTVPSIEQELRREAPADETEAAQAALTRRRERAAVKKALPSRTVVHPVPQEHRQCPRCQGTDFKPLGPGRASVLYEYVPGHVEKQVHVRETGKRQASCRVREFSQCASLPAHPG